MRGLKESGQAVGAQVLTELAGFAPPTIIAQAARLQARQRFFNLVVTNVPGPQFPLYLLGRRMTRFYPVVPLAQRQALGIAIMSYDGRLGFGLLGDYDAMPDLEALADDLRSAIAELTRAAGLPAAGSRTTRASAARRAPAHSSARSSSAAPDHGVRRARGAARMQPWVRRRRALRCRGNARSRSPRSTPPSAISPATRPRCASSSRGARQAGAQLVLFPELAITGYPPEDLLLKEHFLADARAAVERIAADARGIVALVGFPERADDVYNAAAVLADGARPGHLSQGQPAQLRRLRRAALLPGAARAAP